MLAELFADSCYVVFESIVVRRAAARNEDGLELLVEGHSDEIFVGSELEVFDFGIGFVLVFQIRRLLFFLVTILPKENGIAVAHTDQSSLGDPQCGRLALSEVGINFFEGISDVEDFHLVVAASSNQIVPILSEVEGIHMAIVGEDFNHWFSGVGRIEADGPTSASDSN